jgi:hypothetical protein
VKLVKTRGTPTPERLNQALWSQVVCLGNSLERGILKRGLIAVLTVVVALLGAVTMALTDEAGDESKDKMVGRVVSQVRSVVDAAGPEMVQFNSKPFLVQEGKFKDQHHNR